MATPLVQLLQSARIDEMEAHLKACPGDFSEAIELAAGEHERVSWRAAWLLGNCSSKNDDRIRGSIDRLIAAMDGKPDGHWRELLKLVSKMRLNDEQEGRLFELSMRRWQDPDKQASGRWKAFEFMAAMVEKYPELSVEVKLVLRPDLIDPLSPGIRNSVSRLARKILAISQQL